MNKEVLVLFKTHLDIGFTDFSKNIIKKYIEEYIPNAIRIGYELKNTDTPFIWTVGSWLIWEALKKDTDGIVSKAISDSILNWHAMPFTTHTELFNKQLFEYGLSLSEKLDKRFNKKTIAAKMTDVPGHTIGMVPLMYDRGISFLHIGVNPATPLPNVPPLFKWKYSDKSITVMYQGDYGEVIEFDDFIIYFAHTHDNCGPQSASEVIEIYEDLKEQFPGCSFKATTLNEVAQRISAVKNIPVIDKEIGDTWIHGAATDPEKLSRYRKILRHLENNSFEDIDLSDNLLLVPEHTWGLDIKKFFSNKKDFYPEQMEECKQERKTVEKSWAEQREYVYKAEKLLDIAPDYPIAMPDLNQYEEFEPQAELPIEISWQIFDNSDFERYKKDYMRCFDEWAIWDFTKVGLPEYKGEIITPHLTKAYKNATETLFKLEFDKELSEPLGLPFFYLKIKDNHIELKWFSKKNCRLPQACWLKFKDEKEDWEINKLNTWIKPENVIGSPLISAVDKGIRNDEKTIIPLDSALVAPFGRKLLHYEFESLKQDMYFLLYDNIWNTNFPIWYSDDAIFRFIIKPR